MFRPKAFRATVATSNVRAQRVITAVAFRHTDIFPSHDKRSELQDLGQVIVRQLLLPIFLVGAETR
jgi:RimJ/RimL family protein N-acetyltransferase